MMERKIEHKNSYGYNYKYYFEFRASHKKCDNLVFEVELHSPIRLLGEQNNNQAWQMAQIFRIKKRLPKKLGLNFTNHVDFSSAAI